MIHPAAKNDKRTNKISSTETGINHHQLYLQGQRRMKGIAFSLIAMAICFPLYYLGLFGGQGPLNPGQLGSSLAKMGLTKVHMVAFFTSLAIFATVWNWVYNLVCYFSGTRLTCAKQDEAGVPCGALVTRKKLMSRKGGEVMEYLCEKGHRRSEAHFHPVKKGVVSQTLCVIALAFCMIVLVAVLSL